MIPYNLFILPVIFGYLIVSKSLLFKFNNQRLSPNIIIFETLTFAILICASGFVLRAFIPFLFPGLITELACYLEVFPVKNVPYFWTVVLSCLLMALLLMSTNFLLKKREKELIKLAINEYGSELEKLLVNCLYNKDMVLITLKNDKIYIGYCEKIPNPKDKQFIKITPILSGYREKDTKKMVLTTDYFEAVSEYCKDNNESNEEKFYTVKTDTIIKTEEILTATVFDYKMYNIFNK
ncbi:MAG TPA: hypothetical protein VKY82_06530 [Flavobacterium sp.]|nr:hypothetical protein [Flavobacterium sp.]